MTKPNAPINSIPDLNNHPSEWYGLTKREYFAAMALQGILANKGPYWVGNAQIAEEAVMIANKLIESLNDTNNPNLQP